MQFRAVLFDLDGTLLNTLKDIGNAVNRVLAGKGFPVHELDAYRYFVGDGTAMLINRALPEEKRNDDVIRACITDFLEDYGKNWNVRTKPYEGIPEMLDALNDRGLKMAILSNKPHEFTKQCATELLSNWNFDVVIGQRNGVPPKPDPAGALEVAKLLNLPPADFLYIGDSGVDMKTAVASGMFPVGVLWGFRSMGELKDNGSLALVDRPSEILSLLYSP
ncbi:MAG: HAD family hydrolase [Desulfobacteraceae bacterium 4484_190.2]|nr:MAG: HAD family hydrolase [Desulfobacteraceae bacterium 4484_190.2]